MKNPANAQLLLEAAMAGNTAAVRLLFDAENLDYAKQDVTVNPALDISKASLGLFRLLNLHGADERLNAPLYLAASRGHEGAVAFFIAQKAFDQRSLDLALFAATQNNNLSLIKLLETAGADSGFGEGLCLAESIREGHTALSEHFLKSGKGWNQAMIAYIESNQIGLAFGAIGEKIEPLDGLKAITCALSGRRSMRGDGRAEDPDEFLDLFDNLLAYAEGLGADMPQLIAAVAAEAFDQAAPAVLQRLAVNAHFAATPEAQQILDDALAALASAAVQNAPMGGYSLDNFALLLLEMGGNPQRALESGVALTDMGLVRDALDGGADPRRQGRAALNAAQDIVAKGIGQRLDSRIDIYQLLQEEAGRRNALDFLAFVVAVEDDMTLDMLRRVDAATNRSGLMLAIAADKAEDALALFVPSHLRLSDLQRKDDEGLTALELLQDKNQAHLLLDRRLWSLNEGEYGQVFAALSPLQQNSLQVQHLETANALAADRANWQLRQSAERNRNRFKPQ